MRPLTIACTQSFVADDKTNERSLLITLSID